MAKKMYDEQADYFFFGKTDYLLGLKLFRLAHEPKKDPSMMLILIVQEWFIALNITNQNVDTTRATLPFTCKSSPIHVSCHVRRADSRNGDTP